MVFHQPIWKKYAPSSNWRKSPDGSGWNLKKLGNHHLAIDLLHQEKAKAKSFYIRISSIFAGTFSCELFWGIPVLPRILDDFSTLFGGFVHLSIIGSSHIPLGPNGVFFDRRYRSLQARLGSLMDSCSQHPVLWGSWLYPRILLPTRPRFAPVTRDVGHFFFGSIWGVWTLNSLFPYTRLGAVHLSRNMSAFGWDIFPSENIWTTIESTNFNCIYMNCIMKRRNKWVSMRNNNELHSR